MSGSENPVEARPAASLTANLLARRGGARPAMRRQPMANLAVLPITEDLGWNDMGEDAQATYDPPEPDEAAAVSPINQQIQALAERMNARPTRETKRPATLSGAARKAAFTLRIDADRHLRLRLLSAVTNRSAQQLLIEALDALVARNDQLTDLAERAVDVNITADMKWGS
jgi:hypothetical protein